MSAVIVVCCGADGAAATVPFSSFALAQWLIARPCAIDKPEPNRRHNHDATVQSQTVQRLGQVDTAFRHAGNMGRTLHAFGLTNNLIRARRRNATRHQSEYPKRAERVITKQPA